MRWIPLFALVVSLSLLSCSAPPEEELMARGTEAVNARDFGKAIEAFETLLDKYPEGQKRVDALFALGSLYQNEQGDLGKALACYREISERHPDHTKAPSALFLIGFIYNNDLHQLDSARGAYQEFLKRYPTSEMAASAEFELSHLGKSPEEIIAPKITDAKAKKPAARKR
jgi:outer membrane protein assembly factor BamD